MKKPLLKPRKKARLEAVPAIVKEEAGGKAQLIWTILVAIGVAIVIRRHLTKVPNIENRSNVSETKYFRLQKR